MSRRLPPLNALRAFEAAARHLSFTKGAAELHVTQAAVSHQVKALEEHLALWLVPRLGRFREACPHIDIRLDPNMALVDFAREDVDVAIRYGRGEYPGM